MSPNSDRILYGFIAACMSGFPLLVLFNELQKWLGH